MKRLLFLLLSIICGDRAFAYRQKPHTKSPSVETPASVFEDLVLAFKGKKLEEVDLQSFMAARNMKPAMLGSGNIGTLSFQEVQNGKKILRMIYDVTSYCTQNVFDQYEEKYRQDKMLNDLDRVMKQEEQELKGILLEMYKGYSNNNPNYPTGGYSWGSDETRPFFKLFSFEPYNEKGCLCFYKERALGEEVASSYAVECSDLIQRHNVNNGNIQLGSIEQRRKYFLTKEKDPDANIIASQVAGAKVYKLSEDERAKIIELLKKDISDVITSKRYKKDMLLMPKYVHENLEALILSHLHLKPFESLQPFDHSVAKLISKTKLVQRRNDEILNLMQSEVPDTKDGATIAQNHSFYSIGGMGMYGGIGLMGYPSTVPSNSFVNPYNLNNNNLKKSTLGGPYQFPNNYVPSYNGGFHLNMGGTYK